MKKWEKEILQKQNSDQTALNEVTTDEQAAEGNFTIKS